MAKTKAEVQVEVNEIVAKYDAAIAEIKDTVAKEAAEVEGYVNKLVAKIEQIKNEPGVPVDYSVDLSGLNAGLANLKAIVADVEAIETAPSEDPAPVTEPTEVVHDADLGTPSL